MTELEIPGTIHRRSTYLERIKPKTVKPANVFTSAKQKRAPKENVSNKP